MEDEDFCVDYRANNRATPVLSSVLVLVVLKIFRQFHVYKCPNAFYHFTVTTKLPRNIINIKLTSGAIA